jgi:hypothetical protein
MPFDKPKPGSRSGPMQSAGWDAEQDVAFRLDRAFGDPSRSDIRLFHDIRLPVTFASGNVADGDFFQIDHLVLHRHGFALVESKSVYGDLNVDHLGQWRRRSPGRETNISSPVTQVQQQAAALLHLCQSAAPALLNKLLGVAQQGFGHFPAAPFVAIGSKGRFTGATAPYEAIVMKVDQIVEAVSSEIERHRSRAGVLGFIRGTVARDTNDAGTFNLKPDELNRIQQFLLARHTPLVTRAPEEAAPRKPVTTAAMPRGGRMDRLEALSCRTCHGVKVKVVYARDYCLKCEACGKFSPLPCICPLCGKHATVRKSGLDHFRQCDGKGGCGSETVFARSTTAL